MHWIDWLFIAIPLIFVLVVVVITRRYMRSVADFLSAGRLAGRYLLTVAKGEMGAGAVVFVASFELIAQSGFTVGFWSGMATPLGLIIALTGFVIYRYRETRAMTLAQFFEVRYNKSFRVFTGFLGFAAGILNFGIIPAIGARFLTYMLGLPPQIEIGNYILPTSILLMGLLLSVTLYMTLSGGLISLMMADCVEGILSQILYLVIIFGLVWMFDWSEISQVLTSRPPGQSMLNPFDSLKNQDFNIFYVLITMFTSIYGTMAWQNQSAFNSAAISAHEAKMAGILSKWREIGKAAVMPFLAVCALTFLNHPDFAAQSAPAHAEISRIADPQMQKQMALPIGVEHMLPTGIKGALCVILLMGVFGGDGTHLHSWGSLFIQDVILPLRKKPLTPKQHIRLLRWSIAGVALFAFAFGSLFHQTEYIFMWWSVTTAIYVGGAGACIIGGLYWKKGTTAGAWTALLIGSILSTGGIFARQAYGNDFPLNGVQISFFSSLLASLSYIVVSLLTCREDYNMDRMLHRGQYAKEELNPESRHGGRFTWAKLTGINEKFSRSDKWIASGLFGYSMFWFFVFLLLVVWNVFSPWPISWWSAYWHFKGIGLPIFFAVVTAIWFTWGGIHDMIQLFRKLKQEKLNALDNGMVVNNQNLDDTEVTSKTQSLSSGFIRN